MESSPLNQRIKAAGFTLKEMASKVQLHPSYLRSWVVPKFGYFTKIGAILGMNEEEIRALHTSTQHWYDTNCRIRKNAISARVHAKRSILDARPDGWQPKSQYAARLWASVLQGRKKL